LTSKSQYASSPRWICEGKVVSEVFAKEEAKEVSAKMMIEAGEAQVQSNKVEKHGGVREDFRQERTQIDAVEEGNCDKRE